MKVFSLQAPIYRGAWLSSRLTAQTSQLAAVGRDALERWRRARSRGLSAAWPNSPSCQPTSLPMAVQAAQDAGLGSSCHIQGALGAWKKANGPVLNH
jgi:hypothetical protein